MYGKTISNKHKMLISEANKISWKNKNRKKSFTKK